MTALDTRNDNPVNDLAAVEDRLTAEFPSADRARIHDYVDQAYRSLTPAKVTSYLAIFVARQAKSRLVRDCAEPVGEPRQLA